MKTVKGIFGAIVLVVLLVFGLRSFYTVQPGERAFLVEFGQVKDTVYSEGLHGKNPFTQKVVIITVQNRLIDSSSMSSSKDLQDVTSVIALNYAILPEYVQELYLNVGRERDIERVIIDPAIHEVIKAATAQYTAEELITKRSEVRAAMVDGLVEKLGVRGIKVIDLNIIDFKFSEQFNQAIEAKVQAEQNALKEKNNLEKVKYQAQQEIERSKAEAQKIKIQAEAVTKNGGAEYVQLQWIAKWDGKLPTIVSDDNMFMDARGFASK